MTASPIFYPTEACRVRPAAAKAPPVPWVTGRPASRMGAPPPAAPATSVSEALLPVRPVAATFVEYTSFAPSPNPWVLWFQRVTVLPGGALAANVAHMIPLTPAAFNGCYLRDAGPPNAHARAAAFWAAATDFAAAYTPCRHGVVRFLTAPFPGELHLFRECPEPDYLDVMSGPRMLVAHRIRRDTFAESFEVVVQHGGIPLHLEGGGGE